MSQTPVGVVGLGLVGRAIAGRLRAAGYAVLGFDVSGEACEAFAQAGGQPVRSAAEVGRGAKQVVLAVFETQDVISVLEGAQGLLSAGHQVGSVIDCSTGDPELLAALAGRLKARGVDFLEAPLSGSSQQIAAGEATMLLGGETDAIHTCDGILSVISARRIHVGGAGMAARAKLATNLVLGLNRAVLAEGMVFAQSMGIAPERFLELVLATPARSDAAQTKGPLMVSGDFTPQSRIRQHLKDVELMLAGARDSGVSLPFSEAHARLMRDAVRHGDGDLDNAAIIRQLRRGAEPRD